MVLVIVVADYTVYFVDIGGVGVTVILGVGVTVILFEHSEIPDLAFFARVIQTSFYE